MAISPLAQRSIRVDTLLLRTMLVSFGSQNARSPVRICVYCSSSDALDGIFLEAAQALGREIGLRGHELVYGGASVGLMGALARSTHRAGGQVTGIIPRMFAQRGLAYQAADNLIITETLAQRKAAMIERAESFVALPGGFGTLEELAEVLTLKQLGLLQSAVVLINVGSFYDALLAFFEQMYTRSFAREAFRALYHLASGVDDALNYVEAYRPGALPAKWFGREQAS